MSFSYYPVNVIAMCLFSEKEKRFFLDKVKEKKGDFDVMDLDELFDNNVNYHFEDEIIEPNLFTINGKNIPSENTSDFIIMYAEKSANPFKAAYSKEELINEFKNKYKNYLPNNFVYEDHIGEFSGVSWG